MPTNEMKIPEHVAIILDGNGRWAKQRHLPRTSGHEEGAKRIKDITIRATELKIKYLTIYCFSTENWKRDSKEVSYLMDMPVRLMNDKRVDEFDDHNVKLNFIGDASRIPSGTWKAFEKALERTAHNTGLVLTFAFNYGGLDEIVRAINKLLLEHPTMITEQQLLSHLDTAGLPDVDLLIRPGGEQRTSNFLPLQIRYAELYFCKEYWPDFHASSLDAALLDYTKRDRRYGGIKK